MRVRKPNWLLFSVLGVMLFTMQEAISQTTSDLAPKQVDILNDCRVERYTIPSKSLGQITRVAVTLPPQYMTEPERRFPTLYAMHGYGAPWDTWAHMSTLRVAIKKHPMIVITFDGDKHSYANSPVNKKIQYVTFFFEELIPFIDKHYRSDAGKRGATGFSMGGGGSFNFMLTKPEAFCSVSGLSSAFFDINEMRPDRAKRMEKLLGKFDEHKDAYLKHCAYTRIKARSNAQKTLPPIYLECGKADRLINHSQKMTAYLKKHKFDVTYVESEGGHNWAFWLRTATNVIEFHAKHFGLMK